MAYCPRVIIESGSKQLRSDVYCRELVKDNAAEK